MSNIPGNNLRLIPAENSCHRSQCSPSSSDLFLLLFLLLLLLLFLHLLAVETALLALLALGALLVRGQSGGGCVDSCLCSQCLLRLLCGCLRALDPAEHGVDCGLVGRPADERRGVLAHRLLQLLDERNGRRDQIAHAVIDTITEHVDGLLEDGGVAGGAAQCRDGGAFLAHLFVLLQQIVLRVLAPQILQALLNLNTIARTHEYGPGQRTDAWISG